MRGDYPVLDGDRTADNNDVYRVVLVDTIEPIEPRIPEVDFWCEMPVRISHDTGQGIALEIGPYTLDDSDIDTLRGAIALADDIKARNS